MKKKRALFALLLAGAMTFGIAANAGCKKKKPENSGGTDITTPGTTTPGTTTPGTTDPGTTTPGTTTPGTTDPGTTTPGTTTPGTTDPGTTTPGTTTPGTTEPDPPQLISEDTAKAVTVGDTLSLAAAEGAVWSTSDKAIADVSESGVVTAKLAGVAKIKATKDNSVVTCTLIVMAKPSGGGTSATKPSFSFNGTVNIGSVDSSQTPVVSDPNATEYKVTFTDGASSQMVAKKGLAVEPRVEKADSYLQGWYTDGAYTSAYNFDTPVTANLNLHAKWGSAQGFDVVRGNFEGITLQWDGSKTAVEYSKHGANSWTAIDGELVREEGGTVTADIVGLEAGLYDVKANGKTLESVYVKAYDRSGYAHFKYTEGVGAYNDDGTLKDNAIVIYVTDENKDTVMRDYAAAHPSSPIAAQMFDIPYMEGTAGKNWAEEGKKADGLGWWLNNAQYTKSKKDSKGNLKLNETSNTYSANGAGLAFANAAFDNTPICIRFIGKVTTPEGCTAYDALAEGGSVGDNGHMARLKNLKNITIEGVGDGATLEGWGIHFMVDTTGAGKGRGKSFEVRNLIFDKYPEDAIGMEGVQSNGAITASVERCWVHNNTFLPGYCANPAESDKKEGDGSCDFKRGQYFTCSYNYFEYCHKTNLVGSSDDSLQYNLSYHHNMWYQCGSRIPLTRQANVHFYNNYVKIDATDPKVSAMGLNLSYVHSLRASCYLFSEANYYDGCKNVRDSDTGGAGKGWNNTLYACSNSDGYPTEVTDREQSIANNCKYKDIDYTKFDTDPNLFYYDAENKVSDCMLDDSISARVRALLYSGAQEHYKNIVKLQDMCDITPSKAVSLSGERLVIDTAKATGGSETNGVLFASDFKGGKGGKNLPYVATFTLSAPAIINISASGTGPQIIRSDGKMYIAPFTGSATAQLDAGTYIIGSGEKGKIVSISSLSFEDTGASREIRITAAKTAIAALPDEINVNSKRVLNEAAAAYASLIGDEVNEISAELVARLQKAQTAYEQVMVNQAIARIEYIGEVTANSGADIIAAEAAVEAVSAAGQSKITNYAKLTEARKQFTAFATVNVKDAINSLPASTGLARVLDSKPAIELAIGLYEEVIEKYNALNEEQAEGVSIADTQAAVTLLKGALKPFVLKEQIADLPESTADNYYAKVGEAKTLFESLTEEQKATLTQEESAKLAAAIEAFVEYNKRAVVVIFAQSLESANAKEGFVISGKNSYKDKEKFNYEGTEYTNPLKMESKTTVTFTTTVKMKLTIKITAAKIKVDGVEKSGSGGTVVVEIEAGTHTVTKGDSCNLLWLSLVPVAE